jgi:hypothetical protein
MIRVTVRDPAFLSATMATPAIRVNDGLREMRQLAETFLGDFIVTANPPAFCVRNFSDSCPGKQQELEDIRLNRENFIIKTGESTYRVTEVHLNSGWLQCTAPGGPSTCALVVAPSRFVSENRHSGQTEVAPGTALISGIFEQNQWRLCDSRFEPPEGIKVNPLFWR